MLRVLTTTNQTYLATKQDVAVCGKLLQEVESRSNFATTSARFTGPRRNFI